MTKTEQLFFEGNDDFSRLCSEIWNETLGQAEEWEDYRLFNAPSECAGLIARSQERKLKAILEDHGFTPQQFVDELEERTDPKTVYFMFGEILELTMDNDVAYNLVQSRF